MNVDSSRVWPPAPQVILPPQQPLDHPPYPQTDPALAYNHPPPPQQPQQAAQQGQQQTIQDPQHHQYTTMARAQQPYDVNNAPLTFPPPAPPPGAARSSPYGQAPQGVPYPPPSASASTSAPIAPAPPSRRRDGRASPKPEAFYAPNAAELYNHAQMISNSPSPGPDGSGSSTGNGRDHYPSSVPRLPPILQVEKQQVTTTATQAASASRRRNEAHFVCPVPGCGSTFTRRFNLRGHLRSHTEERPYVCDWPGCKKGFARQHDCKRHQALHSTKSQSNLCPGCKKTFSRLDALNRHLRSEGGSECRQIAEAKAAEAISAGTSPANKKRRTEEGNENWEGSNKQGTSRT